MWRSLAPALAGLLAGLAGAAATSGLMRGLVFGAATLHPTLILAVGLGLSLVAALATWLPARRITKLDPLAMLRAE
jgi:ABC-type antimicrobial peptide transport system permease subunit